MASTCGVVASAIAAHDKAAASQVSGAAHVKVLGRLREVTGVQGIGSTLTIRGHDYPRILARPLGGSDGQGHSRPGRHCS
jgi:hypothetical protein